MGLIKHKICKYLYHRFHKIYIIFYVICVFTSWNWNPCSFQPPAIWTQRLFFFFLWRYPVVRQWVIFFIFKPLKNIGKCQILKTIMLYIYWFNIFLQKTMWWKLSQSYIRNNRIFKNYWWTNFMKIYIKIRIVIALKPYIVNN